MCCWCFCFVLLMLGRTQEENGELKNEFRQVIGGPLRQPPPLAITIPSAQVAIVRRHHITT